MTPLGLTRGHERQGPTAASAFTLDNGQITVTVWDYGAHLVSVRAPDRAGQVGELVVGPTSLGQADDPDHRGGFRGATVGRYANRIANAAFTLDGVTYELAPNDDPNHLHGGRIGFDQYVWGSEVVADSAEGGAVRFSHHSPDGDEGYPGALTATVTFNLHADNRLTLSYTAESDAPTIISLTNHVYWNLAGSGSVVDHELQLHAEQFVMSDNACIPVADPITNVAGTRFDFRQRRPIGGLDFGDGYDDCFVLAATGGVTAIANVFEPNFGRSLTVSTDQPGVQLYTANHLPEPHQGFCLETQALPDSPNRPAFLSPVLRPGEIWRSQTLFVFGSG